MKTRLCRILSFLLVCVLLIGLLTGCPSTGYSVSSDAKEKSDKEEPIAKTEAPEASEAVQASDKPT